MKYLLQRAACLLALWLVAACSETSETADKLPPAALQAAAAGKPGFVNKVWEVSLSTGVAPGMLYVFLSDGTLVITSRDSRASLGAWTYQGGALTMTEDGQPYQVDILGLSHEEFRIRSKHPGGSVEIAMVPAKSAPLAP